MICCRYATDAHCSCHRHLARQALFDAAPWDVNADWPQPTTPSDLSTPPARWGDAAFYEYRPVHERWYCKLCWKYADDRHLLTPKHVWRAQNPVGYAQDPEHEGPTDGAADVAADDPALPAPVGPGLGAFPPLPAAGGDSRAALASARARGCVSGPLMWRVLGEEDF